MKCRCGIPDSYYDVLVCSTFSRKNAAKIGEQFDVLDLVFSDPEADVISLIHSQLFLFLMLGANFPGDGVKSEKCGTFLENSLPSFCAQRYPMASQ